MKKLYLLFTLFILLGLGINNCGGRLPSEAKTAQMSKKYFKKYGKKFEAPSFYEKDITAVEVQEVRELQRHMAMGVVVLKMSDGEEIPVLVTALKKVPMGWRIVGWEKLDSQAPTESLE